PFSVTPDPRFFYTNPLYQEALSALLYGIEAKKGFIVITGEVGTGKSTLLRKLMRNLQATTHSVFIFNTQLSFPELLELILHDLGLASDGKSRLTMLQQLNDYLIDQLQKGHTVALLIDEAQNLSDEALEGLRLLSNLETDKEKLLQIVLMGQPELELKLAQPQLRQLKQRVALQCRLARLGDQEVGPFIDFRLQAVGYEGERLFNPDAVKRIAFYSKGIPRLINIVCDNALLNAYGTSQRTVSAEMIEEVADDLRVKEQHRAIKVEALAIQVTATNGNEGAWRAVEEKSLQYQPWRLAWVGIGVLLLLLMFEGSIAIYSEPTENELSDLRQRIGNFVGIIGEHFEILGVFNDRKDWKALKTPPEEERTTALEKERPYPQSAVEGRLASDEEHKRVAKPARLSGEGIDAASIIISEKSAAALRSKREPPQLGLIVPKSDQPSPKDQPVEGQEERISLGMYRVVKPSPLHSKPRADSDLITTLEPPMRVRVVGVVGGGYLQVRSVEDRAIRGYVHREDAWFERSK
ncbi:MAG: ExeA family protein, partial [Candidatus Binatia bacterium]